MKPKFDYGDEIRITRNIRNDGTYPGVDIGKLLIHQGSIGNVRDIGTYLQDTIIYSVYFVEQNMLIGCKEDEVISVDASWIPSKYEFRDKVNPTVPLAINGKVIAQTDTEGEVIKVLKEHPEGVAYHVRIVGRTLLVPETRLTLSQP